MRRMWIAYGGLRRIRACKADASWEQAHVPSRALLSSVLSATDLVGLAPRARHLEVRIYLAHCTQHHWNAAARRTHIVGVVLRIRQDANATQQATAIMRPPTSSPREPETSCSVLYIRHSHGGAGVSGFAI